jgi:hypothetical protein
MITIPLGGESRPVADRRGRPGITGVTLLSMADAQGVVASGGSA